MDKVHILLKARIESLGDNLEDLRETTIQKIRRIRCLWSLASIIIVGTCISELLLNPNFNTSLKDVLRPRALGLIFEKTLHVVIVLLILWRFRQLVQVFVDYYRMQGDLNINRILAVALLVALFLLANLILQVLVIFSYGKNLNDPNYKTKVENVINDQVYGFDHSVYFVIGIFIS